MKRIRVLSLVAILLLTLSLTLASCGERGETTPAPSASPVALDGLSGYALVYPTDIDPEVFRSVRALQAAIREATGVTLALREDFVGLGQAVPTDTREILIGATNRAESRSKTLRRDDSGIYFENNRLVIAGGSDETTVAAIERYMATYLADGKVLYPGAPDITRGSYAVDSVTLGGVSLSEYAIVRDQGSSAAASYLRGAIADATGYVLPILSPRDSAIGGREIVIGNPGGEGRVLPATAAEGSYRIEMSGTRLYLFGDGADGAVAAVLNFLSGLNAGERVLSLSFATPKTGTVRDFSLFTLNLPAGVIPTPGTSLLMTTETVMERFRLTRDALPEEVTVLSRVSLDDYRLSTHLEVYVCPTGDDKAKGTKEAPLATLAAALDKVRSRGGAVIWMMEGDHRIDTTVAVTNAHSGTRQAPLFIKAYGDGDVTLTANTPLSTDPALWSFVDPAENAGVYERLPDEVRGEILYTRLADHGLTSDAFAEITKAGGPPKLYVGEEEYTLARYPNDTGDINDLLYFEYVYDTGSVTSTACLVYWPWVERATAAGKDPKTWQVGWETRIPTNDERGQEIISWVNTGDIWYFGSCYSGWEFGYYQLALETEGQTWAHNADGSEWDPASGETPYLGTPKGDGQYSLKSVQPNSFGAMASGNSPAGHNTYYLFNAVEALDVPGEWYLDREAGILYVYPTEAMENEDIRISGTSQTPLLQFKGVQNVVLDGINIDGANSYGIEMSDCRNVVVQNAEMKNTGKTALYLKYCYDAAVLYCDFSRISGTMLDIAHSTSAKTLTPTGIVIQNCVFHDAIPTYQVGVGFGGYRTVVSHNYFVNTTSHGAHSVENIIEYNVYEGGSKDVTDGGMIYTGGAFSRGNHYRKNLIHMFNATHNAIYNDGSGSGNYAYGNMISFIGSKSNFNKGWYSSTGMGNVCFGNIMILRNPYQVAAANSSAGAEDGYIIPANSGDAVGESALFYYHFGEEYAGASRYYTPVDYEGRQQGSRLYQSEAGHWWYGNRVSERDYYFAPEAAAWYRADPCFMNLLEGSRLLLAAYDDEACDYNIKHFYVPWYLSGRTYTYAGLSEDAVIEIPQYTYLDASGKKVVAPAHVAERNADGSITLTYEELAAMERFRRQPAVCVISDNVLLGGTPTSQNGAFTEISAPNLIITDTAKGYQGYVPTSRVENNFFEYRYDEIIMDAENQDYDLLPGALEAFREVLSEEGYAIVESIDWTAAGLS